MCGGWQRGRAARADWGWWIPSDLHPQTRVPAVSRLLQQQREEDRALQEQLAPQAKQLQQKVDAALAPLDRVLPGWDSQVGRRRQGGGGGFILLLQQQVPCSCRLARLRLTLHGASGMLRLDGLQHLARLHAAACWPLSQAFGLGPQPSTPECPWQLRSRVTPTPHALGRLPRRAH
jgi:hypothetical protein